MVRVSKVLAALGVAGVLGCGGGSGTQVTLPARTCDQACTDGSVIYATWLSVDATLYNDEVVAHTLPRTGVACPGGGTVDISGTATNIGGTNTLNLTYVMNGCRFNSAGYDLTFTGTLLETGQFNNSTSTTSLTYASASLTWTGTVGYSSSSPYPASGSACAVSISKTSSLSGSLCGRPQTTGRLPP